MGKTEKIVVLSVLFAVVVLFVWSLQGPEARAAATGGASPAPEAEPEESRPSVFNRVSPIDRRPVIELERPDPVEGTLGQTPTVASANGTPVVDGQGLLNSAVVVTEPTPPERGGVELKKGWDLVTTRGLEPTVDPEMMLLSPEPGATWASLATDLYGDENRTRLLRHYNEGMELPGEQVLVPAVDDLGPAPAFQTVEVLDGESLWLVAERTLGAGARWKEVFELNRDVISDASKVRAGMMLRVPASE